MEHPSLRCLAQVITRNAHGVEDGGSGYLVAPGWVLTAAHVVRGKNAVGVWLGADQTLSSETRLSVETADILFADGPVDLALLPVAADETPDGFIPVGFGLLDRESLQELEIRALGFPWFKLRPLPGRDQLGLVREVAAVAGSVIGAGNDKSGTFAVHIPSGPDIPLQPEEPGTAMTQSNEGDDTARSVWGGMSGAAVWVAGRLIGVMGRHYIKEGAHTLTAWPLEPENTQRWTALDKVPNLTEPPVVNAPTRRSLVTRRARRAARQLAPERLSDRVAELALLDAFALGESRWCWIQAPTFAGKTALVAWWTAHHQLDHVDVAACFLRRTTGANTAEDAISTLSEQLAGLANPPRVVEHQRPSAAAGIMLDELLPAAAESARESGRRLLLVVEGLDEYTARPGQLPLSGWLPDRDTLPEGAALLVTSRKDVPVNVGARHPLGFHVQTLEKVEIASRIRAAAEREIKHALSEPYSLAYRILGFLAAAGGGLTLHDLTDLIQIGDPKVDQPMIETACESDLRRTITGQGPNGAYAFSHDALRAEALNRFPEDNTLRRYRDDLHRWAEAFAGRRWPSDTPGYLVTGYTNMLVDQGDADRLSAFALDRTRHRWLHARRGGNDQTLKEIGQAAELLARSVPRDVGTLVLLAFERDRLHQPYRNLPTRVPVVWAMLGNIHRAEAIARSMPVDRQPEVLAGIALVLAEAGNSADAERIAYAIADEDQRKRVLAGVARALAEAGNSADAERIAGKPKPPTGAITYTEQRKRVLAGVVRALAEAGNSADAERIASEAARVADAIPSMDQRVRLIAGIARALAEAGYTTSAERIAGKAEQLADASSDNDQRSRLLAGLALALAEAGNTAGAERIAGKAEQLADAIFNKYRREHLLAGIALAKARAGNSADAERIAKASTEKDQRETLLARIAWALAEAGNSADAERIAKRQSEEVLGGVALALAAAGKSAEAERIADTIADKHRRAEVLAGIAPALAEAGNSADAERIAANAEQIGNGIIDRSIRESVLAGIALALAAAGKSADAERIADTIADKHRRAEALSKVALALASNSADAARIASKAERIALTIKTEYWREKALAGIALAQAEAGNSTDAERIACSLSEHERVWALSGIARALAEASNSADAERIAATITDTDKPWREQVLAGIALGLAAAGKSADAERIADTIADKHRRAEALSKVALALASNSADAARIASKAERIALTINTGYWREQVLAGSALALAAAGKSADAERIADTIADKHRRAEALSEVALALAKAGKSADSARIASKAERIAVTITNNELRGEALARIALGLAEAGNSTDAERIASNAEQTANAIINRLIQEKVLTKIALAKARAGNSADAERIARPITEHHKREEVLAGIVRALTEAGNTTEAERIACEILTTDSWHVSIALLLDYRIFNSAVKPVDRWLTAYLITKLIDEGSVVDAA